MLEHPQKIVKGELLSLFRYRGFYRLSGKLA
jgi:hypothetical protein